MDVESLQDELAQAHMALDMILSLSALAVEQAKSDAEVDAWQLVFDTAKLARAPSSNTGDTDT